MSVVLVSFDGVSLPITHEALQQSRLLKTMFEDTEQSEDETLKVPVQVDSDVLAKVIIWCEYFCSNPRDHIDSVEWAKEFVNEDIQSLKPILEAADYLDIPELLHTGCKHVARKLETMDAQDIKYIFGVSEQSAADQTARAGAVPAEGAAELEAPVLPDAIGPVA